MEKKRPQLNLAELYQLKWLIGGVLALLSAWTVLYMDVDAAVWLVLVTVAVPVVLRWPALTLKIPRWAHRLAFPLFVGLFAADFYLNREPLPATIRLALMLVFYRSVTPRKRRDDLQLILLGLFLVVIAGVLSVSLAFAVQIVVFTGCALIFLLLITLIDSAEGVPTGEVAQTADRPATWMRSDWRRLGRRVRETMDWRVAMLASGLFAGVVGLSALLFFALPRFEFGNSFFLDNLMSKTSKTGFSESVRFGDVTAIQQDNSVAMRVEVSDVGAIPADPYWRMLVLDSYSNGLFSMSEGLRAQLGTQRSRAAVVRGSARPRPGDVQWIFYLESGLTRYLPLLGSFRQLQFDRGAQDYAINDELRMLRLERTPAKMFAYRVDGLRNEPVLGKPEVHQWREAVPYHYDLVDDLSMHGGAPPGPPTFLDITLEAEDIAKVEAWARALGASENDPQEFSRRACAWLARTHAYSLHMSLGEGLGDSLVRWIGSTQPGHCELFAGAFTLLARSVGYPTRLVTGFRGGTWNSGSGHLSIRNSDAHAWCEIYDAAADAWVRVDPTPGGPLPGAPVVEENVEARLARIADSGWSSKLDGLRMFWYRRIVDFDQQTQVELAREAKKAIESRMKALRDFLDLRLQRIGDWFRQPWDVPRLVSWSGVVVLAFGLVFGWRRIGRSWWLRLRSGMSRSGADPVRREAGRWLRRLDEKHDPDIDHGSTRAELERLRYGPRANRPDPHKTFSRAKAICRRRR